MTDKEKCALTICGFVQWEIERGKIWSDLYLTSKEYPVQSIKSKVCLSSAYSAFTWWNIGASCWFLFSCRPFTSRMWKSRGQELWRVPGSRATLCLVYWRVEWPRKYSVTSFLTGSLLTEHRVNFWSTKSFSVLQIFSLNREMLSGYRNLQFIWVETLKS